MRTIHLPSNDCILQINRSITRSPGIIFDKFQEALKTHTVHIDVYCTASDADSDSDTTVFDSDEEMDTIFKSDATKVTHRRAKKAELPYSLQALKNNIPSDIYKPDTLIRNDSYSGDDSSTAYPSALSSYSTITDFEKSFSSGYPLWCPHSVSNCSLSEYNKSSSTISCKNSVSDSESVYQRRHDLRNDASFISGKSDVTEKFGRQHVIHNDSFEYADSSDLERIQKMEQLWNSSCESRSWKSPQAERRHVLQQQKIQEYIEKKLKSKFDRDNDETDTEKTDISDDCTVIVYDKERNTKANLTRGSTIHKSTSTQGGPRVEKISSLFDNNSLEKSSSSVPEMLICDPSSKPVISNNSVKSNVPDVLNEPFWKTSKFGTVIGTRNLGRHVGPTKNPDCLCAHCRTYFSENSSRNRTRSVGTTPFTDTENWRNILKPRPRTGRFMDY